jgi:hypothetical protein
MHIFDRGTAHQRSATAHVGRSTVNSAPGFAFCCPFIIGHVA